MKKTLLILVLALAAFSACRISDPAEEPLAITYDISGLRFNFTVLYPTDTRAVKSGWTTGDIIFIFFSGEDEHYLTLEYGASAWAAEPEVNTSPGGGSLELDQFGVLTAIYLPYGNSATPSYDGVNHRWSFSDSYTDSYFLKAEKVAYQITDTENAMGTLGAVLEMEVPAGYAQLFIPNADAVANVRLACNLMKPGGLSSIADDGTIAENPSGAAGDWITGYNATVGGAKGYYVSGKPVDEPDVDCYFALRTESAAYKHYYKYRDVPIAVRGAYKLPGIDSPSWISVSSSDYVSLAGYTLSTVSYGASTPWAVGGEYASNAIPSGVNVPSDAVWNALLSTANTRWIPMSMSGVSGSLIVDKTDETQYLFLPAGNHWSATSSHYLHLAADGTKQLKTTDPPEQAYVRSIKYHGGFVDPIDGGEI